MLCIFRVFVSQVRCFNATLREVCFEGLQHLFLSFSLSSIFSLPVFVLFSPRVFQSNVNCQMSFKACASIDKIFSFPSRSSTHSCVKCDFAYVTIFFTGSYLPCTYQKLKMAHTLGGRIWLVCWNFQGCDFLF